MSISAVMLVYNEEARIEATLRCATWCDEIVVLDKHSTDRTREIALRYTPKVIEIPYSDYDPHDVRLGFDLVSSEWILLLTASDVLHPLLAGQIRSLVDRADFPYDVIHVPFRRYVLGMSPKRSPWYGDNAAAVFRKAVVSVVDESVHAPFKWDTKRVYRLSGAEPYCLYHLTHETVDSMMNRNQLYWRSQARLLPQTTSMCRVALDILRAVVGTIFKRKVFLLGWSGLALGAAYISYFLMQFAYVWECRFSKAGETYDAIRSLIAQAWEQKAGADGDDAES